MILEKQKENLELTDGEIHESYATVIDFDSADFLKQMLSKFYSDAVGSLIRETASNALDSHREINSSEPIIVSLGINAEGNWEYSVEDFGVGIDKDTINNILRKYGKSTKRHSVNQLGAYGLGWKSPLAYSSSFYFIGRKNGIEIKCMMYEGEEDIKIDILSEQPTEEKNGCKVIVPVKRDNTREFSNKISEQLAYFENVYFNVNYLDNDFKIHREKDFQYSELVTDSQMHICLDNVYYPIDFQKLGIDPIYVSLGLRFSLTDGLFPVPNRESIKYTAEAKEIILNKIKKVSEWLVSKYNENCTETDDLNIVFTHFDTTQRYVQITDSLNVEISKLISYSTINIDYPTIKGLKRLDTTQVVGLRKYLLKEFQIEYYLYNGRVSIEKHWKEISTHNILHKTANMYTFSERLTPIKKEYIKDLEGSSNKYKKIMFIKKREYFSLWNTNTHSTSLFQKDFNSLYIILGLDKVDRALWREHIEDFFYVRDLIINPNIIDIDKLVIPTSFIDSKKTAKAIQKKARMQKQLGDVTVKVCTALQNHSYTKYSKLVPEILPLNTLHKKPLFIVYGSTEDAEKMDKLFGVCKSSKALFVVMSDRELKKVEDVKIHNLMSLEEFMKGDNKVFRRIATAQLINILKAKHSYVFNKISKISAVSEKLVKDVELLEEYRSSYYKSGNSDFTQEIVKFALANNKFDETIYREFLATAATFDKLYFLNKLTNTLFNYYGRDDESTKIVVDLCKYHKYKVNLTHYSSSTAAESTAV